MKQELTDKRTRIDKYLWSIRIFKTRTRAAEFCASGKVKLNDVNVKASHIVKVGERYSIRMDKRLTRIVEVIEIIESRKSFDQVKFAYRDLTVWPTKEETLPSVFILPGKNRRPTKKNRRDIDSFNQNFK